MNDSKQLMEWFRAGRAEERKHLVGVVKNLRLEQTRNETDNDWFFGHGYNAAIHDILKTLSDPSEGEKCNGVCGMCAKCQMVNVSSDIQEETECCYIIGEECNVTIRCDCRCHKPRTEPYLAVARSNGQGTQTYVNGKPVGPRTEVLDDYGLNWRTGEPN